MGEVFWFYDQPGAFNVSPAIKSHSRRDVPLNPVDTPNTIPQDNAVNSGEMVGGGEIQGAPPVNVDTKDCPSVFKGQPFLQLDQDVYVACDVLRPFYIDLV